MGDERKLTALLAYEGDNGVYLMDVAERDGRIWLVPNWLDTLDGTQSAPERIVPLDQFPHEATPGGQADFVLTSPVPKSLFYGDDPQAEAPGFEVYLHPARRSAAPDH